MGSKRDEKIKKLVHELHELKQENYLLKMQAEKDIVKNNYTESQCNDEDRLYFSILKSAIVGFWRVDMQGQILEVNNAYCQMSGYSENELLQMHVSELDTNETKDDVASHIQRVIKNGEDRFETQHRRKDGSIYDIEAIIQFNNFNGGQFVGFLTGISDRKEHERLQQKKTREIIKAQKNAEINQQKYKTLTQNVPGMIYSARSDWSIVFLSNSELICGFSPYEFKNGDLNWTDLIIPEDRDQVFSESNILTQKPTSLVQEYRIKTNDNSIRYIEDRKISLFDSKNNLTSIDGIVIDITEQKKLEDELRIAKQIAERNEDKYKKLSNLTFEGILIHQNGNVIDMNQSLSNLLGYSYEELLGENIISLAVSEKYHQIVYKKNIQEYALPYEIECIKKDGSVIPVEVEAKVIDHFAPSNTVRVVAIRDITNRKKIEKELREALKSATESDRLKSSFLANLSHEIRTPLNGIMGFASLLKEPSLSDQEIQDSARLIEKSGDQLLSLLTDLVDISRIESGEMKISISETNISNLIYNLFSLFKQESNRKGLDLSCKSSLSEVESVIYTDHAKVETILSNLLKNAIKYSNEGHIIFGYEKKDRELEFFVKDKGIGINQEMKKIIFEKFRQAYEGYSRNYDGAGLGLTISKSYVKMLGGKIWVESEEGKGSIFYFTLPYSMVPEKKTEINIELSEVITGQVKDLNILIAEDNELSGIVITKTVERFAGKILRARTGIEAVNLCKNNPTLDLILMDILMPEMNGYEAIKKIRDFNTDVVIIALTAFIEPGSREKAIEAGSNDYIAKPINIKKLTKVIHKCFSYVNN